MIWQYLSFLLLCMQGIGIGFMLLAVYHIIQAVSDQEGLGEIRGQLWLLFRPLVLGFISIALLMSSIFIDHLGGTWLKFIAPVSTIIWMFWVQIRAPKILAGTFFNALVPLVRHEETLPTKTQENIDDLTWQWIEKLKDKRLSSQFSSAAFLQSVIYAIESGEKHLKEDILHNMSAADLIELIKSILHDFHRSVLLFPLAQRLTLADWMTEGRHFHQHSQKTLTYYSWGRFLINPLSLLDHKKLWKAAGVKNQDIVQQELSAWLHAGIYRLTLHHICVYTLKKNDHIEFKLSDEYTQESSQPHADLWSMLTSKLRVPMWLYLGVGAWGCWHTLSLWTALALIIPSIALYIWSERTTFNLARWQAAFSTLAQIKKESSIHSNKSSIFNDYVQDLAHSHKNNFTPQSLLDQWHHYTIHSLQVIMDDYDPTDPEFKAPQVNTLDFDVYRCELLIPDIIASTYYICDDFLQWYQAGGFWSKVLSFGELVGFSISRQRLDQLLIKFLHDMAHTQDDETLNQSTSKSTSKSIVRLEHEVDSDHVTDITSTSWISYIQKGDDAINRYIPKDGISSIMAHKGLQWIHSKGVDWIHEEINRRVIPLYTGTLPPLDLTHDQSDKKDR